MKTKEQIKAEIERQKKMLPLAGFSTYVASEYVYTEKVLNDLLSFIDSLPDEPSENIGQLEFLRNEAIEMIAALEHDISISIYDGKKGHDPEAEKELGQWRSALMWLEHFREATKKIDENLNEARWLGRRKATKKLNEANCGIQFFGNLFTYLRKKGELDGLCRKNGREWEYDTDGIIEKARANKFNYKGR